VLVRVISAHAVEEERTAASIMLSFAWPGTGIKRKELRTKLCISREDSTLTKLMAVLIAYRGLDNCQCTT
jgi:hypothetical protein